MTGSVCLSRATLTAAAVCIRGDTEKVNFADGARMYMCVCVGGGAEAVTASLRFRALSCELRVNFSKTTRRACASYVRLVVTDNSLTHSAFSGAQARAYAACSLKTLSCKLYVCVVCMCGRWYAGRSYTTIAAVVCIWKKVPEYIMVNMLVYFNLENTNS